MPRLLLAFLWLRTRPLLSLRWSVFVCALAFVVGAESAQGQSVSVAEWNFGTTSSTANANVIHSSVSNATLALNASAVSGFSRTLTGTSPSFYATTGSWTSTETSMLSGRTSTSPISGAKVIYSSFTLKNPAYGDWSSMAVKLDYMRVSAASPVRVRAYLTWREGGVWKTRYSGLTTLSGTTWVTNLSLPLSTGSTAPAATALSGNTFLLELQFSNVSSSTNSIHVDNVKFQVNSLGNSDYSDYSTFTTASSTANGSLKLGASVDAELAATTNTSATGDDTTNTGSADDEDGVTLPALTLGTAANVPVVVTNNTGAIAHLRGWIDYDGNGLLTDSGELVISDTVATGTTSATRTYRITPTASGTRGIRFRLSNNAAVTPTSTGDIGEIEDYVATIGAVVPGTWREWTLNNADENATVNPSTELTPTVSSWTPTINSESFGTINWMRMAFNPNTKELRGEIRIKVTNAANPFQGFRLALSEGPQPRSAGRAMLYYDGSNPAQPKMTAYVYDTAQGANSWSAPGQLLSSSLTGNDLKPGPMISEGGNYYRVQFYANLASINNSANYASYSLPADWKGLQFGSEAGVGLHFFKFSAAPTYDGTGKLATFPVDETTLSGGLKQYVGWFDTGTPPSVLNAASTPKAQDFGDWNGSGAGTWVTSSTTNSLLKLGAASVDSDATVAASLSANDDDNSGTTPDDEDATTLPASINASISATFTFTSVLNNTGAGAYLNGWVDFNGDGMFDDALVTAGGERLGAEIVISPSASTQSKSFAFVVPVTAVSNPQAGVRFRLTSVSNPGPTGDDGIGEVEDYTVNIIVPSDFGDWSGAGAATSTTRSVVDAGLRLGATIDNETSASSDVDAVGDGADEDGATVPASITSGASVTIPVSVFNSTGGSAYLNAWIDFNNDGSFNNALITSGGERLEAARVIASSGVAATENITFIVPANASVGSKRGVRFRLTNQAATPPTGAVGVGEVEDYVVSINQGLSIGNLVWSDTNNNGSKDATETGVSGLTVQIYTPGSDGIVNNGDDVLVATTVTNAAGGYNFTGLLAGDYYVEVTPSGSHPMTSGTPSTTDNNTDNNNDGSQSAGLGTPLVSPKINLTIGSESISDGDSDASTNYTVDFGLFTGIQVGNLVWNDANRDGNPTSESGVSGLTVALMTRGLDSTPYNLDDAVVTTTTTNASGAYGFTVFTPGTYYVRVTPNTTYPLASPVFASTDTGIDNDNNGIDQPGGAGTAINSSIFTLAAGSEPGAAGATNAENSIDIAVTAPFRDYGDYPGFVSAGQIASTAVKIGANATDGDPANPASGAADADDLSGLDDDDVVMPTFTVGSATNLIVPVTIPVLSSLSGSTSRINVFVDWNGDGDVIDTNETQIAKTAATAGTSNVTFSLTPPAGTLNGTKYLRIRITEGSTAPSFSGTSALKGEVEDYAVTVIPASDFGDWSGSGAQAASTSSIVNSNLLLGSLVDAETSVTPNATASADGADDDGATMPAYVILDQTVTIPVRVFNNTGANARLKIWIDFNNDGTFNDNLRNGNNGGELLEAERTVPSSASATTQNITFTVPANSSTGTQRGVRIRLSDQNGISPTGPEGAGEVEDYVVSIYPPITLGNYVWADLNNNGVQDVGEPGLDGVSVTLRYDANGDGDFVDAGESSFATTVTSGGGLYSFTNLQPGPYRMVIATPPTSYPWASKVFSMEDDSTANDSNGVQSPTGGSVHSPVINLALGETNQNVDFGLTPPGCASERMVMYLTDLSFDIVEKFRGTGSTGVPVPGGWGGIPWLRKSTQDGVNGLTNPHGVYFSGSDVYIGGIKDSANGTYRYNQKGEYQSTVTDFYRLTHVTIGNYIYYGRDSFVSIHDLTTGAELGRVNLTGSVATTWGICLGRDGFIYVGDNYQSSTFPNGNAVKGAGHVFRVDPKPSTFTSPATVSYNPIISGLDDLTGIDTDAAGNIYVVEVHIFDSPAVYGNSRLKKFSPSGVLLGSYSDPTPLNGVGFEDAWGMRWNPLDNKLYIACRAGDCVARIRADTLTYDGAFIAPVPSAYGKTLSIQVECAFLDMGDLRDALSGGGVAKGDYQTFQENSGPTHIVNTNLRIGATVDAEHAASSSSDALGDDLEGADDEDGITSMPVFPRGQTLAVPVSVYNATGSTATLFGFLDWNDNGNLNDSGEKFTLSVPTGTNGVVYLNVTVPATATLATGTGARFRLSTTSTLTSLGAAPDGEVEDYLITITQPTNDYGDWSGSGALTTTTTSIISTNIRLGATVDSETSVTPDAGATADGADEDGVTMPASIGPGASVTLPVTVSNNTGSNAYLNAWIDFNNDGTFNNTLVTSGGERLEAARAVATGPTTTVQNITFTVPITASVGAQRGVRFRLTTLATTAPTGAVGSGEVEDYVVTINPVTDFGDWNRSGAGTTGTSSNISANLRMGATVDAEVSVTPDAAATADGADEDGVTMPASITQNQSASIPVSVLNNTGSNAYLNAWIDFNDDGIFNDALISAGGERLEAARTIVSGATASVQNITFVTPVGASVGTLRGVRFRLTDQVATLPTGVVGTGEVEDYVVTINQSVSIGNLVWNDANNNGIKDGAESGLGGATVQLFSTINGIVGDADDFQLGSSIVTGATGAYSFIGILPGNYYVKVTPPAGFLIASGTPATTDNNIDSNNDGAQPGGPGAPLFSPVINLTVGAEPTSDGDADTNTNYSVDFGLFSGFTVGDLVFNDANNNGIKDTSELGISGLTVELLNGAGASFVPAVTTTTNASGNYAFLVYAPGTYKIKVTPNSTYPLASTTAGTDNATDNNNDGTHVTQGTPASSFAFTLTAGAEPGIAGQTNTEGTIDFGFRSCPTITVGGTLPAGTQDVAYGNQTLTASGGVAPYTWVLQSGALPAGLTFNNAVSSTTATITGTPTVVQSSTITIRATDATGCYKDSTYTITVGCPAITIAPAALGPFTQYAAISAVTMSASGGRLPYTWSATGLPAGLSLSSSGTLSGTPSAAPGSYSTTINLTDNSGCPGSRAYTIVIGCPTVSVSNSFLSNGTVGTAYPSTTLLATTAGTGVPAQTYTWTVTPSLPTGMTLSTAGVLGGTPTVVTPSTAYTFTARNQSSCAGSVSISFSTACPTINVNTSTLAQATVGTAYSQSLNASGGTAAYAWTLVSGSWPAGMSMSSAGVVSGTPTTPTTGVTGTSVTVKATDANGCVSANAVVNIKVCPVISLAPATMPAAVVGTAYSQTITASNGTGPYTYAVTSGSLPSWATLTSAGVLSGTPSNTTSASFRVTATDAYGCTGVSAIYTIIPVCPTITITPGSINPGVVGSTYNQSTPWTASGGTAPYTWSATGVPTGMIFSAVNAKLTGTPVFADVYNILVRATDARGCIATLNVPFSTCPAIAITPSSLPAGTIGFAYSQLMKASQAGFDIQQAFSSTAIGSLAAADDLLAGTNRTSNWTGAASTVSFSSSGAGTGHYTDTVFPAGAGDDFALKATGIITIPTGGDWTFGTNSDDGVRLKVDGSTIINDDSLHSLSDRFGTVTLSAGTHTVEMVFFERSGGEAVELFAASGSLSSWSAAFKLIGSSTGLPVVRPSPTFTWNLTSGALPPGISLDSNTGMISGAPTGPPGVHSFILRATDAEGCAGSQALSITTACPTISFSPASLPVGTVGSAYSQLVAASGSSGSLTYAITSGTLPAGLNLNTATGEISGAPTSANGAGASITITATDAYACAASINYTLKICPVISITPSVTSFTGIVGTAFNEPLTASDGSAPYDWSIASGSLPAGLTLSGGAITGVPTATASSVPVTIRVTDAFGCIATRSYTISIDCPVVGIETDATLVQAFTGVAYALPLTPSGGSSPYLFTLASGTLPDGLTLSSAGVISGTPTTPTSGTTGVSFSIGVTDQYGCAGSKTFTLKVCPIITIAGSPPVGTTGEFYTTPFVASGSSATPYTYAITDGEPPPGLTLGSDGVLSGTPTASGAPSITITATDINGCTGSATFPIPIGCPVMTLSPTTAATGTVGTLYSQTISATGGVEPFTYTVLAGNPLPAGLSLSAEGVISGTPTAATSGINGTVVNIQALDQNGCTGTAAIRIKICPVITISPATISYGTVGTAYSQTITQSGGATPAAWSLASGTLPAGLGLNGVTGLISGTPTAANGGGVGITMQVSDANACVQTKAYWLKICPVIPLTPSTIAEGLVGSVYSQTVSASNGAAPYTYTISSGTLPDGLTLNSSTGVISGTPTTANGLGTTVTVTATDANFCQGSRPYTIKICPVITLAPASLPAGFVGAAYAETVTASGGAAPYVYAVSSGALPAWATLNSSTGQITGTPNTPASASFTITATDASNCVVSASYTISTSCPTIAISPTTINLPIVGSSYTQATPFSATGVTGTYNWSATGVPPGMTFDATNHVFTGTPTAAGVYSVVITAQDSTFTTCSGSLSLSFRVCPVINLTASLLTPTVGNAYSRTISSSGGAGGYSYAVISGSPPAGLNFSSGGNLSGTATSNVTAVFTVRSTDSTGCIGTQTYTMTPSCPTISVLPSTLAFATVGTAYNQATAYSATGLTGNYSWTATGLPPGMSFNSTTRKLTGTPATAGVYPIVVTATDSTYSTCSGSRTINLRVCPVLNFSSLTTTGIVGTAYTSSAAASNGTGPYSYSVSAGTLPPGLTLATGSGAVTGTPTTSGTYNFTIAATDATSCPGSQDYTITISCPTITVTPNTLAFATVGSAYSQTVAFGAVGLTGAYTWSASGLPAGLSLNTTTKKLTGTPNIGSQGLYNVTITATDSTYPSCSGSVAISLRVCPVLTISPSTLAAGVVGSVYDQATPFSVNGGNGPYIFAEPTGIPPGLSWDAVNLKLIGTPTTTASTSIVISVIDADNCPGTLTVPFTVACPTINISGTLPGTATQDTNYGTQTLSVSGGTAPYNWIVVSGALPTGLTLTSGVTADSATITGTPTVVQSSTFTIRVSDSYGCVKDTVYSIAVGCPVITITPATVEPFTQYAAISGVTFSAVGGRAPYAWSATGLPAGLSLSGTGVLTGIPTAAPGSYSFTVNLSDNSGCPGSQGYTIVIGCPTVSISTSSLPDQFIGSAYPLTTLAATTAGTSVPAQTYTWSVSPALPPGMSLSSAGVISGTPSIPTAPTSYTFTAVNQHGCAGTRVLTFSTTCPTIAVSPTSLAFATVGLAYIQNPVFTATGLTGSYVWTVSGLPPGLSLDAANAKLIGTPDAGSQGVYNVTITATDSTYPSCSGNTVINLRVCPVLAFAAIANTGTVGVPYSSSATASNGTAPYAYSVSAGALPAGLSLDAGSGAITGTPTVAGTYNFTVAATDGDACPGSQDYTITVTCPTISIAPTTLPDATVGAVYTQPIPFSASTVGDTNLIWAASNVPPGMSFNDTTLVLEGTPTSAGAGTITITVTDGYLCAGSINIPFARLCPGLSLSPATVAVGYVQQSYSSPVAASGGTAPYTYSISSGTLPAGLSIDPDTGAILGTPTVTANTTVTIQAIDALGCIVSAPYDIEVRTMSIGNLVFDDCNFNGVFDGSDTGLAGATVRLFSSVNTVIGDGDDAQVGSDFITTASGAYNFTNIPPGNYYVKVTPPATHLLTGGTPSLLDDRINDDNNGAQAALGQPAFSPLIELSDGDEPVTDGDADDKSDWTVDFGFWSGFTIGDLVWNDANNNGLNDSESGVNGLAVALMTPGTNNIAYDGDDVLVATTHTNGTGYFGFQLYTPGTYYFTVTPNAAYPVIGLNRIDADNGIDHDNNAVSQPGLSSTLINGTTFTLVPCTEAGSSGMANIENTIDIAVRACPTMNVTPVSLAMATVGVPYTQAGAFSISGGFAPYIWSATNVPPGMTFNTATQMLEGTPTTAGTDNIIISVTDMYGCSGSISVPFTRGCPTITVSPSGLPFATAGSAYNQTTAFTASSLGDSDFTWSASNVPAGMSFNASIQKLEGTPSTAGLYSVNITATDGYNCSGTTIVSFRVCPVLAIAPGTLSDAHVGLSYAQGAPFIASNGTGPYIFGVTGLPPGLSFDQPTSRIVGIPTTLGTATQTFTLNISVVDADGCPGFANVNLTVVPAMRVGDAVWLDSNNNGTKDSGEPGVAGVTMQLWNCGPNNVEDNGAGDDIKIGSDVLTDVNGNYVFENVIPGTGYYVLMPSPLPNRGVAAVAAVSADNGVDNDNNALQPGGPGTLMRSPKFTLTVEGEPLNTVDGDDINGELTLDFGVRASVCVGNLVFRDIDNDGIFNASSDQTINGVTLQLFHQGDDPLTVAPVQTMLTSNGGWYVFCVLPGDYFIYVPASDFVESGPLYGNRPTIGYTDTNVPQLDDDADQNALVTVKPYLDGVRTGNFTLAAGTMPTATSGESGHLENVDDAWDTDVNFTIDLGFYPVAGAGAPLAGRVRRDLTGTGDITGSTTPLEGVEVVLYADTNNNGLIDTNELGALDTTTTDATGTFAFTEVDDGHYIISQTLLPGATATSDTDGGDPEQICVTLEGEPVNNLTFLQTVTPDTFAQWQQQHPDAGDNNDGDQYDSLMEYALGTSPDHGDAPRFQLEEHAGTIDAVLLRGTSGHNDIRYRIEASDDMQSWHTLALAPAVTTHGDGTDTVRYVDVAGTQRDGFIRLSVTLDANLDGTAEASSVSPAFAFHRHESLVGQQTFSMPLAKPALWSGKVTCSGTTVTAAGATITQGQRLYLEVLDGEQAGHHVEVDASTSTDGSIKLNTDVTLTGNRVALRAHWTVDELFPATAFVASTSASKSDRVLFFDAATQTYRILWLCQTNAGSRWFRSGDATLADAGKTIVAPADAVILHARTHSVNLTVLGEVRTTKLMPLQVPGSQLLGTAAARALTPETLTGVNRLQLWIGDTTPASTGYATFVQQGGVWTDVSGGDVTNTPLLKAFRGHFVVRESASTE